MLSILDAFALESLVVKDFLLGFFMALALRRGRIETIISRVVPNDNAERSSANQSPATRTTDDKKNGSDQ